MNCMTLWFGTDGQIGRNLVTSGLTGAKCLNDRLKLNECNGRSS